MSIGVIVAAGGRGARLGALEPKQFLVVSGKSLLTRSIEAFRGIAEIREIVVVLPEDRVESAVTHVPAMEHVSVFVVAGGLRRQDSVAAGLRALSPAIDLVLVHDAARAFVTPDVIERTITAARDMGAAVAALNASDTVKRGRRSARGTLVDATLPREEIYLAQTPQAFRREVLEAAVALGESGIEATDEARLAELAGFDVVLVEGDRRNIKVTTPADVELVSALTSNAKAPAIESEETMDLRIGVGYDSHRLVEGRPLVLGGVRIPHSRGLEGHSDADAVAHAVTDAVLGAAGAGDIGQMFPDSDQRWRNADSLVLLALATQRVSSVGYGIVNVDVTVIAQRPKLSGYRDEMCKRVADALGVSSDRVSIKAKTNEGLDAVGREEGIVVYAVALLARDVRLQSGAH